MPTVDWLSQNILRCLYGSFMKLARTYFNTTRMAISSVNRIEPYEAICLRSSTVSMSGGKIAAPAPQGPWVEKQDPLVKTTTVFLCVSRASFSTTCLPNCSCTLDRDWTSQECSNMSEWLLSS